MRVMSPEEAKERRMMFTLDMTQGGNLFQVPYTLADGASLSDLAKWFEHKTNGWNYTMQPQLIFDVKYKGDIFVNPLVFDLDPVSDAARADVHPDDLVELLRNTLRPLILNFDELDMRAVAVGNRPLDKNGRLSVHVYFPFVRRFEFLNKVQKQHVQRIVNAALRPLGFEYDVDIGGLAVWTSDKPLKESKLWRGECKIPLLDELHCSTEGEFRLFTCPLFHALDRDYVVPLFSDPQPEQPPRKRNQQRREREDEDEDVEESDLEPDLLRAALLKFGQVFTPGAVVRKVEKLDDNVWSVYLTERDPQNECPQCNRVHHDNHYFILRLARATVTLDVYCGHHGGGLSYPIKFYYGLEPDQTSALLLEALPAAALDAYFFVEDFEQAGLEPPPWASDHHRGCVCISSDTYRQLCLIGDDDILIRYLNFAIGMSSDGSIWVRSGNGKISSLKTTDVSRFLKPFFYVKEVIQNDKTKKIKVDLYPMWMQSENRAMFNTVNWLRYREPPRMAELNLLIPRRVAPVLAMPDERAVETVRVWLDIYTRCLVDLSIPTVTSDDRPVEVFKLESAQFIRDWLSEVVCGYSKVKFLFSLFEPIGGAGKSLVVALVQAQLGVHQVKEHVNLTAWLQKEFGVETVNGVRLDVCDEGIMANDEHIMGMYRQLITKETGNKDKKHGENGVSVNYKNATFAASNLGHPKVNPAGFNRRLFGQNPSRRSEDIIDVIRGEEVETDYERYPHFEEIVQASYFPNRDQWWEDNHEQFLRFGWDILANMQSVNIYQRALGFILQEQWTPELNRSLMERLESQEFNTVGVCGADSTLDNPLRAWIYDRLILSESGEWFTHENAGVTQNDLIYSPRLANLWPDYVHLPTLRYFYNASQQIPTARFQSDGKFRDAFQAQFNAIALTLEPINPTLIDLKSKDNHHKITCDIHEWSPGLGWQPRGPVQGAQLFCYQVPRDDFRVAHAAQHNEDN